MLLRVDDRRSDVVTTTDVAIEVSETHTVDQLAAAIARYLDAVAGRCGPAVVGVVGLRLRGRRHRLEGAETVVAAGLLSGDWVELVIGGGGARTSLAPAARFGPPVAQRPDTSPIVVVTSGPDVGRSAPLDTGVVVGRDPSCELQLTDPAVARRHAVVRPEVSAPEGVGPQATVGPIEAGDSLPTMLRVDGRGIDGPTTAGSEATIAFGSTTIAIRDPPATVGHEGLKPAVTGPTTDAVAPAVAPPMVAIGATAFRAPPYRAPAVEPVVFEPLGNLPEQPEPPRFPFLAAFAPVVFGVALAVIYSPRMLMFAAFAPLAAVAAYVEGRRRNKARHRRACTRFDDRLERRRDEVDRARAEERRRRQAASPDLVTLARVAAERQPGLWSRGRDSLDALHLRLGLGNIEASVIIEPEHNGDEELWTRLAAEWAEASTLADSPVVLDLIESPIVGLIGEPRDTTPLVASLILQAAVLHSPADLSLAVVIGSGARSTLGEWLTYLPHLRPPAELGGVATVAEDDRAAERLVAALVALAEQRRPLVERDADRAWPRVLLVLDDEAAVDPSTIAELLSSGPGAGISLLIVAKERSRLPRQVSAIVQCAPIQCAPKTRPTSAITRVEPSGGAQSLIIERTTAELADRTARALAPLVDISARTAAASLPPTVTFNDALGTGSADASWVLDRWSTERGDRLPATIGVTKTDPLVLDLVADGPHGLIGGTSGSGKSELLTAIVAGLIADNPPTRVNLLFVDYKGGASSAPFRDCPHTVGSVTNLDAGSADRALISLQAELTRRMNVLEGRAKDMAELRAIDPNAVPPSLVIVVDEFATLVAEIPDFVGGVVDIAQRGRSLGIHLLLATQRPSGSVNESILANTNLRISLRMLDGPESVRVIGTNDAAAIPPEAKGRGLARLGPGQLIPFQTAWTGAPQLGLTTPPITVGPISKRSSRPAVGADAPLPEPPTVAEPTVTQLEQLLTSVAEASRSLDIGPARSPILPPLPPDVSLASVLAWPEETSPSSGSEAGHSFGWRVPIGLVDDPVNQRQYPAVIDLAADGGLAIFGAPGSGKTTTLLTLALAASAEAADSQVLTIVGFDAGSGALAKLRALPPTAAVATGDDIEATTRLIASLETELKRRRAGGDGGPRSWSPVLVLIDGLETLAAGLEGPAAGPGLSRWLEALNRVIVEGRRFGICTALTAARRSGARSSTLAAITGRLVLAQIEPGAYVELGVSPSAIPKQLPPGRGYLHGGQMVQVANPGLDPTRSTARGSKVCDRRLVSFPLPERIDGHALAAAIGSGARGLETATTSDRLTVPLGVADVTGDLVAIDLASDHVVVGGPRWSGRSSTLASIALGLLAAAGEGRSHLWAVGRNDSPLPTLLGVGPDDHESERIHLAFGDPDQIGQLIHDLQQVLAGPTDRGPHVLLIDDVDRLDPLDDPRSAVALAAVLDAGVRLIAAAGVGRGYASNPVVAAAQQAGTVIRLQPAHGNPSAVHDLPITPRPGVSMPPGRAIVTSGAQSVLCQLALPAIRQPGPTTAPTTTPSAAPVTQCRAQGRSEPAPVSD